MAWIEQVAEEDAAGPLEKIYRAAGDRAGGVAHGRFGRRNGNPRERLPAVVRRRSLPLQRELRRGQRLEARCDHGRAQKGGDLGPAIVEHLDASVARIRALRKTRGSLDAAELPDLEQAIADYVKIFGQEPERKSSSELKADQAFFYFENGTFLELIQPTDAGSPISGPLAKRGQGVHTVAFAVDDRVLDDFDLESADFELRSFDGQNWEAAFEALQKH